MADSSQSTGTDSAMQGVPPAPPTQGGGAAPPSLPPAVATASDVPGGASATTVSTDEGAAPLSSLGVVGTSDGDASAAGSGTGDADAGEGDADAGDGDADAGDADAGDADAGSISAAVTSASGPGSDTTTPEDGMKTEEDEEDGEEGTSTPFNPDDYPHGCTHYRRRCKVVAPCCDTPFWCRLCHDAEKYDGEMDFNKAHQMDRHAVREVVCALCTTRQPVRRVLWGCAAGDKGGEVGLRVCCWQSQATCQSCGTTMGRYFCGRCNLFDDNTDKGQFHCDECGICRVGGRDKIMHCSACGFCVPKGHHRCNSMKLDTDCPVCLEVRCNPRCTGVCALIHILGSACATGFVPLCERLQCDGVWAQYSFRMLGWYAPVTPVRGAASWLLLCSFVLFAWRSQGAHK